MTEEVLDSIRTELQVTKSFLHLHVSLSYDSLDCRICIIMYPFENRPFLLLMKNISVNLCWFHDHRQVQ